jgi:hypothetical protein
MKLDKTKPYGEIFNDTQGRCFEQGGNYFDGLGNLVGTPKAPKPKAGKGGAAAEPEPEASSEQQDQIAAQLAG